MEPIASFTVLRRAAESQQIRLNNHLSDSTEHTVENFYSMEDEVAVSQKILEGVQRLVKENG